MTKYNLDAIYRFIVDYKTTNDGLSPTMREIGAACGVRSLSVISYLLDMLVQAGKIITENAGEKRRIKVVGGRWRSPPLATDWKYSDE